MDIFHTVVGSTIAVAVLCIVFSTWTTLSELALIVSDSEQDRGQSSAYEQENWRSFASRAIGHIEHLPRVPHGVQLPGYHGQQGEHTNAVHVHPA
jgi:hypothetical protein